MRADSLEQKMPAITGKHPIIWQMSQIRGRGGMVDATDLRNWALLEKSGKWMLSNSGKPKSGDRQGNPEPSRNQPKAVRKVQRLDGSYPNV